MQRFQKLEESIIKFSDKHQLLKRGLYVGLAINAVLYYKQFVKITALKRMQEYIEDKSDQFDAKLEMEQRSIREIMK